MCAVRSNGWSLVLKRWKLGLFVDLCIPHEDTNERFTGRRNVRVQHTNEPPTRYVARLACMIFADVVFMSFKGKNSSLCI
jgi:hypothetical protein